MKKFLILLFFINNSISIISSEHTNKDLLQNKSILILGGTGYLASEITKEILSYEPKTIVLFGRSETKFVELHKTLLNNSKVTFFKGDVCDYNSLIKATAGIDIVLHFATLKFVEDNIEETIRTNILGTLNVFKACIANKVKKVIYTSTNQACYPINMHGASKLVGEKIFSNYDRKNIETQFITVRFGNLFETPKTLGPVFLEKIQKGESIFLTNPENTRFIIFTKQTIELIFDALRFGIGGEIFVPKLPSIKIINFVELLKNYFKTNSIITITGLRPGEKIDELLLNNTEYSRTYDFKNYYVITTILKNLETKNSIPIYIKEGKQLNKNMKSYSSKNCVITNEKLASLLKNYQIT